MSSSCIASAKNQETQTLARNLTSALARSRDSIPGGFFFNVIYSPHVHHGDLLMPVKVHKYVLVCMHWPETSGGGIQCLDRLSVR